MNIIAYTSIAPFNLLQQSDAVRSWLSVFDEIVSVNCKDEINIIFASGLFPNVTFHECTNTAKELYGKPYPFINDILEISTFSKHDTVNVLLNSDIYTSKDLRNVLTRIESNVLMYANRMELDSKNVVDKKIYLEGIDLFAWKTEDVNFIKVDDRMALGVPFWDLSLPISALSNGLTLLRIPLGLTWHFKHDHRWQNNYKAAGEYAIEFISGLKADEYYKKIIKKDITFENNYDYVTEMIAKPMTIIINSLTIDWIDEDKNSYKLIINDTIIDLLLGFLNEIKEQKYYLFFTPLELRTNSAILVQAHIKNIITSREAWNQYQNLSENESRETPIKIIDVFNTYITDAYRKYIEAAQNALFLSQKMSINAGILLIPTLDMLYDKCRSVVGFTSLYNSSKYHLSLINNISNYNNKNLLDWVVFDCNNKYHEVDSIWHLFKIHLLKDTEDNIRLTTLKLGYDPGLYGIWINAISITNSEYLTNINTDDIRSPDHITKLVHELKYDSDSELACCALRVTKIPCISWEETNECEIWFKDHSSSSIRIEDMFQTKKWVDSNRIGPITSQCIPHCMPVWKRSLHRKYGYFEEEKFSSVADWEFWLRCLKGGAKYKFINEDLGAYYWNPKSYNRIDISHDKAVIKVLNQYCDDNVFKSLGYNDDEKETIKANNYYDYSKVYQHKMIKVNGNIASYGEHRTGWNYAVDAIYKNIHSNDSDLLLEPFIEKKFAWGKDEGDINNNPSPIKDQWIGITHVPPYVPSWFQHHMWIGRIVSTDIWKKSKKYLKGLIALSDYHARYLQYHFNNKIPIYSLKHPTDLDVLKFDFDRYKSKEKPRLIQVGVWLRKMHGIGYLKCNSLQKTILEKPYLKEMMRAEAYIFGLKTEEVMENVEILDFQTNSEYDELLASSILFCDFYDTSANNTVIEAIARNTPIIVPKHPAIVEYLGEGYPLYFKNYQDAGSMADNENMIKNANSYLKKLNKTPFTIDYFLRSLISFTQTVRENGKFKKS